MENGSQSYDFLKYKDKLQRLHEILDNYAYENALLNETNERLLDEVHELKETRFKKQPQTPQPNCSFCRGEASTSDTEIGCSVKIDQNHILIDTYNAMGWHKTANFRISFCPYCGAYIGKPPN